VPPRRAYPPRAHQRGQYAAENGAGTPFGENGNENQNGMIRRKHPKGTNFAKVSKAEIAETENWINSYPRKLFGYRSSEAVFRECLQQIERTA